MLFAIGGKPVSSDVQEPVWHSAPGLKTVEHIQFCQVATVLSFNPGGNW